MVVVCLFLCYVLLIFKHSIRTPESTTWTALMQCNDLYLHLRYPLSSFPFEYGKLFPTNRLDGEILKNAFWAETSRKEGGRVIAMVTAHPDFVIETVVYEC